MCLFAYECVCESEWVCDCRWCVLPTAKSMTHINQSNWMTHDLDMWKWTSNVSHKPSSIHKDFVLVWWDFIDFFLFLFRGFRRYTVVDLIQTKLRRMRRCVFSCEKRHYRMTDNIHYHTSFDELTKWDSMRLVTLYNLFFALSIFGGMMLYVIVEKAILLFYCHIRLDDGIEYISSFQF